MYVKLFTSIYQGTLRGNSRGLLVFTNLLAHCDKEGVVDMHPRAIAEEVGLTQDQVRAALDELEAPDAESRTPDMDGRRIVRLDEHRAWGWRVVNYGKYRAIKSEDDRRASNRIAVAKHRAKKASESSDVIDGNPKSSLSPQAEADTEAYAKVEALPSEAKASAVPADTADAIFSYGVPMLVNAGVPEKNARSFFGGARKMHGDDRVLEAMRDCWKAKPVDPLTWLAAALPPKAKSKAHAQESGNNAVARRFVEGS